jgi:hypothetical protein
MTQRIVIALPGNAALAASIGSQLGAGGFDTVRSAMPKSENPGLTRIEAGL